MTLLLHLNVFNVDGSLSSSFNLVIQEFKNEEQEIPIIYFCVIVVSDNAHYYSLVFLSFSFSSVASIIRFLLLYKFTQ